MTVGHEMYPMRKAKCQKKSVCKPHLAQRKDLDHGCPKQMLFLGLFVL